jgi:UDP-N-acetylglucosamine acyltransferase
MTTSVDPRAAVSSKAQLGAEVRVGPFTIIEDGAIVGDGTVIHGNALIGSGARIGRRCEIHHGAVVGHVPQDLKYRGEPTTCEIGERTIVREYATLHRGTGDDGRTVIGSDCMIMGYCHIAHDCRLGHHVIMANAAMLAGHVEIQDYVILGGVTPVHQFVRIGAHSMIGGGLRIPKDVPPFVLVGGTPAVFEGLNQIGLRRRGFTKETLDAIHAAYQHLYRSGLNVSQALNRLREDAVLMKVAEVRAVVDFVAGSTRGIIGAPRLVH